MQAAQPTLTVRPYQRRDRAAVRDLAFYNARVHVHLDWQTLDEYLRDQPPWLWVAYRGHRLMGVMGLSEILSGTCWLRVAIASDRHEPMQVLQTLWHQAVDAMYEQQVHTIVALLLRGWMQDFVVTNDFDYQEDIVTLRRHGRRLPPPRYPLPQLTHASRTNVENILAIDHAAFDPPWQMSLDEIRQGMRVSAHSTIAWQDGRVVGYQITTTHGMNGHLARLAVMPAGQGLGIGGALLRNMIEWFRRRSILSVTVNTQASNIRSQRLYEVYDFERNGYDLPVWTYSL